MPSMQVGFFSGGQPLVSGNPFSGTLYPVGGVYLRLDASGTGPIYVGLPFPGQVIPVSGSPMTFLSGGGQSSGGLLDGMQLNSYDSPYFIPKLRLTSGISTIRVNSLTGNSGVRLFWDVN